MTRKTTHTFEQWLNCSENSENLSALLIIFNLGIYSFCFYSVNFSILLLSLCRPRLWWTTLRFSSCKSVSLHLKSILPLWFFRVNFLSYLPGCPGWCLERMVDWEVGALEGEEVQPRLLELHQQPLVLQHLEIYQDWSRRTYLSTGTAF